MSLRRALESGLVLGGFWGFTEVAFAYSTGSAPPWDAAPILLVPMVVLALYQASVLGLARLRPHAALDLLLTASVLLPPVVYFLRGRGQRVPLNLLAGLVPLGLGLALVFLDRKRASNTGWLTPGRIAAILFVWFAAALAFLRRAGPASISTDMIVTAALWCGAMALVGAGTAAIAKRHRGPALLAVLAALSFTLVEQRAARPPSYQGKAVRSSKATQAAGAPNIVLIVLDTVRADHLDLYGYTRPTFALTGRYLREGLIFDQAVSSGTFSLPSHGSLFTGLLPSSHGARPIRGGPSAYGRLRPEVDTLASFLRGRGYRTAGVSANDIFLAEWTGLQRGFDVFSATASRALRFTPTSTIIRRLPGRGRVPRVPGRNWTAAQVTNAAIDLAGQGDEPFFLFLNYFDAHDPRAAVGSPPWFDAARASPADVYDTTIASIDSEIARLFQTLEQRGQLEKTLVIVTADHGEYFGEKKLKGHPPVVFQPGTHVPLILRLPGAVAPGRTERRTGLHEVFQMVRDVLGARPLEWLNREDPTPRILTEGWSPRDYSGTRPPDGRPSTTAVYSGNLKLIHRLSGRHELFDLSADPGEARDLIDSPDPRIRALKELMLREVALRAVSAQSPAPPLSEDALERLRALGYLR